ncbi:MAG: ribbon-helix-helix domain-containing protein [Coriobacteriia bacterium]|nr:ribbon-helix-helix domain-containing protein [Coriobacteriia bacterium]
MAKPTVSIPDGMLEDVDRRAAQAGVSRSAFIQEAIARYGESLDMEREQDARSKRIGEAMKTMREIATHMPKDAPTAEEAIRAIRDAPPRWLRQEDE